MRRSETAAIDAIGKLLRWAGGMSEGDEEAIDRDEIFDWLEFGCWIALALTPFLYWVNGPAVSHDQLVSRWAVVVVALLGGIGLRLRAWRRQA